MDFPKSVTIDACEKFLVKLVANQDNKPLVIPVGTSRYAFGGLASAIQAVNTWARKQDLRVLALRQSDGKSEVEELIKRPHKFSAAMFSKSITLVGTPDIDLRAQVNAAAKLSIEHQAASKYGQQRGGLCWFAFVDHSSKGFDRNFYIEKSGLKPEPRQPAQFQAVIKAMVDKSMAVPGGAKPMERDSLEKLGWLFYELFLNTHEHGARDFLRSDWLRPGVRIIYTQGLNLSEEGVQGIADKQPILSAYLDSVAKKCGMDNQQRFVEIGIVDSGLGYCNRWLADRQANGVQQKVHIAEEYGIFKKCFTFRQTSTGKDSKGHGLPTVMDRLTKLDGFMRIRSGRLSLYRDFVASPYVSDDACVFSDWNTGQSAEIKQTSMSPVAGAAISLLIPMEAK